MPRILDFRFEYDDGGRTAAGYPKLADLKHDNLVRSLAIATEQPYASVKATAQKMLREEWMAIDHQRRLPELDSVNCAAFRDTSIKVMQQYLAGFGWDYRQFYPDFHPRMRPDNTPDTCIVWCIGPHAITNGQIRDTRDWLNQESSHLFWLYALFAPSQELANWWAEWEPEYRRTHPK